MKKLTKWRKAATKSFVVVTSDANKVTLTRQGASMRTFGRPLSLPTVKRMLDVYDAQVLLARPEAPEIAALRATIALLTRQLSVADATRAAATQVVHRWNRVNNVSDNLQFSLGVDAIRRPTTPINVGCQRIPANQIPTIRAALTHFGV